MSRWHSKVEGRERIWASDEPVVFVRVSDWKLFESPGCAGWQGCRGNGGDGIDRPGVELMLDVSKVYVCVCVCVCVCMRVCR